jgi:hypothetical protein
MDKFEATILYLKDDTRILVHPVEFSAQAQAWAADRTGRWGADVGTCTSAESFEAQVYSTETIYIETDFDAEKHGFTVKESPVIAEFYEGIRRAGRAAMERAHKA